MSDTENSDGVQDRQRWLRTLALSEPSELDELLKLVLAEARIGSADITELRAPELGSALVPGRTSGNGEPFGMGEITLTRCVVNIAGKLGIGYVTGRSRAHARNVAIADALAQGEHRQAITTQLLAPLDARRQERTTRSRGDVEESRVCFFTMVRGEA